MFSSDSGPQNSSDGLSYASRTDRDTGFLSGAGISPTLGPLDFGRRAQASDAGFGTRPQDTGAMFSSSSMVCLLVL
jgi:hypothetical protein